MQVPDDPRIGFELLGHVANKALSGGYYRDAVTLYRQAVARAQRHGATHPFTQGRTRELIAALLNDGDLRAAQALTRELDVSSGAATSTRTLNVALLARVASMMGEHSTALAHLDGLRDGGHLHTTQTCRTRVNVLRELDRLAEAESAVEECVGPTAESENPRALVTRGYLELARGHAARALEFFNGALDLQLQRARYDHLHVRYTHNAIARANAALGLIDQARAQATFVLESSDPGLTRNDLANAVAFEVLAELALLGGDAASGRANVMRARGLWHAALGRREHPRLRALDALDRWADRLS